MIRTVTVQIFLDLAVKQVRELQSSSESESEYLIYPPGESFSLRVLLVSIEATNKNNIYVKKSMYIVEKGMSFKE